MSAASSPERRPVAEEAVSKSPASQASTSAQDVADQPGPSDDVTPTRPDSDVDSQVEDPDSNDEEEGEIDEDQPPPLPADGPPLPQEAPPAEDDGWDCLWDANSQAWYFYNRFTSKTQWDNPRVPSADDPNASASASANAAANAPNPPSAPQPPAVSGYNPAIHGDYDPNAWYAQKYNQGDVPAPPAGEVPSLDDGYTASAAFNRFTGQFQHEDAGPGRHTDEAKSRRQMSAFFDVDAAANTDDGRSLKAERANKRISKSELKAFKEKRRARKEEKRRAWLRD